MKRNALLLLCCCTALVACDIGSKSVTGTATLGDDPSTSTGDIPNETESSTGPAPGSTNATATTGDDPVETAGDRYCVQTITVLEDLDAVGPTGLLPRDVLEASEGAFSGGMTWLAEGPVRYSGALGPIPLTIEVTYAGGEIRDVDAELVTPCQHDGPCPCEDRLEIDMEMRVRSDDGVLDEAWTVAVHHQPSYDGFGSNGTSIYHRFDPDETQGSLSRASFTLSDDVVLDEMVATGEFRGGSLAGGFNVQVALGGAGGGIGFGPGATFGTVTSLDACPELGSSSCSAAGCTLVSGVPLHGTPPASCRCDSITEYCFSGAPDGESSPALYTRTVPDAYEPYDEVVLFDMPVVPGQGSWRSCNDAPEVALCGCFGGTAVCP